MKYEIIFLLFAITAISATEFTYNNKNDAHKVDDGLSDFILKNFA